MVVAQATPTEKDVKDQIVRVRERMARYAAFEISASRDSDDLSIYGLTLSAHGRPSFMMIVGQSPDSLRRPGCASIGLPFGSNVQ